MLKLASIVEKETPVDSEKPKVAGAYTNRLNGLAGPRFLNAEPTVIYANDGTKLRKQALSKWPKFRFWGLTGQSDLSKVKVASDLVGYQSWLTEGLPPTPIDSPTLSSILAAAKPGHQGRLPLLLRLPRHPAAPVRQDPRRSAQEHQLLQIGGRADAAPRPDRAAGTGGHRSLAGRRRCRSACAAGAVPRRASRPKGSMPTSGSGARTPAT